MKDRIQSSNGCIVFRIRYFYQSSIPPVISQFVEGISKKEVQNPFRDKLIQCWNKNHIYYSETLFHPSKLRVTSS